MPRQIRIEYEGAVYHVVACGNWRNRIFFPPNGADEELFLKTLGECCQRPIREFEGGGFMGDSSPAAGNRVQGVFDKNKIVFFKNS